MRRTAACRWRAISAGDRLRAGRFSGHRAAGEVDRGDAGGGRARRRRARDLRPGGGAPRAGAQTRQPRSRAHARGDRRRRPRAGFYDGAVGARAGALRARQPTGSSTNAISPRRRATWGEPIAGTYRGVTIYETPAPTQGFTVLEMLNLLEPLRLVGAGSSSAPTTCISWCRPSSSRITTATAARGPGFARVPMERLISKSYADERRALIDPRARAALGQGARPTAASPATRCTSPSSTPRATPRR